MLARRYWLLAGAVLLLSALNLTFRLGREIVVEWDESLYGVSAWEMFQNRQWIGTTFRKSLDLASLHRSILVVFSFSLPHV